MTARHGREHITATTERSSTDEVGWTRQLEEESEYVINDSRDEVVKNCNTNHYQAQTCSSRAVTAMLFCVHTAVEVLSETHGTQLWELNSPKNDKDRR